MILPRARRAAANGDRVATIAVQFHELLGNRRHAVAWRLRGDCAAIAWKWSRGHYYYARRGCLFARLASAPQDSEPQEEELEEEEDAYGVFSCFSLLGL